jgi:hypothetical protein
MRLHRATAQVEGSRFWDRDLVIAQRYGHRRIEFTVGIGGTADMNGHIARFDRGDVGG